MTCAIKKIDSNITNLAYAVEECLRQLPTTPNWQTLEPNTYSDFGGDVTTTPRTPISNTRQNRKGSVTDEVAAVGFNTDFTQNNMTDLLQGFFFADAFEPRTTASINAAPIAITGVTASSKTYAAASGLNGFTAGDIILASGFSNPSNNGVKTVASSTTGTVVVNETLVSEASPPANAKFQQIGIVAPVNDLQMMVVDSIPSLLTSALDFTTVDAFQVGNWIFLGDDNSSNVLSTNVGYARISAVEAHALTFDDTTFTPVDETGTGKTVYIYFGVTIKNQVGTAIKHRSYTFERQLGEGVLSTQAEYVEGCVANQLTVNAKSASLMNADLTFVGCDVEYVTGNTGDELKTGNRLASLGEDAFNTSSDMVRVKMNILDPTTSQPTGLFAYVMDATLVINNNATPNKALGVLGAFDVSVGNFTVSGDINAYFADVEAVAAVRKNADVGLNMIFAAQNAGVIFDTPLIGLAGTKVTVTKDQPIMLPLKSAAAENKNGYTALFTSFPYLPTVAMPS